MTDALNKKENIEIQLMTKAREEDGYLRIDALTVLPPKLSVYEPPLTHPHHKASKTEEKGEQKLQGTV